MALLNVNIRPDERQLRQFGWAAAIALPVLVGMWTRRSDWTLAAGCVGLVMALVGWCRPNWLRWVFVALMFVAWPIGLVAGELMMLGIFFGVLTPIGVLSRLLGRDPLQIRRNAVRAAAATYWQECPPVPDAATYFRQS